MSQAYHSAPTIPKLTCRTKDEVISHFENYADLVINHLPTSHRITTQALSSRMDVDIFPSYVSLTSGFIEDEIKIDKSLARPSVTKVLNEYHAGMTSLREEIRAFASKAHALVVATQAQKVYDMHIGSKELSRLKKQSDKFEKKQAKADSMLEANLNHVREMRERDRRPCAGSSRARPSPYSRPSARARPRRNRAQRQFVDDEAEDAGEDYQSGDEHHQEEMDDGSHSD